jgi:hypothetical protein
MTVAAITLMAPAGASAHEWYTHTEKSGEVTVGLDTENAVEVEFSGSLSTTVAGGAVQLGPCEVHANVAVWNRKFLGGGVEGTGEITSIESTMYCPISSPLPIIPPGCTIKEASSGEFPWDITVTLVTELTITGANFSTRFTGCEPSLPPEIAVEGTATTVAVNGTEEVCLVFNNSGDLTTPPPGGNPVTIDGEICAPGLTLSN